MTFINNTWYSKKVLHPWYIQNWQTIKASNFYCKLKSSQIFVQQLSDCKFSPDDMYIYLIMICFFRPGMKDDTYYVRLTVDGKKVPENKHCGSATSSKCRFRVRVCEITCLERQIVCYHWSNSTFNNYMDNVRSWKLRIFMSQHDNFDMLFSLVIEIQLYWFNKFTKCILILLNPSEI